MSWVKLSRRYLNLNYMIEAEEAGEPSPGSPIRVYMLSGTVRDLDGPDGDKVRDRLAALAEFGGPAESVPLPPLVSGARRKGRRGGPAAPAQRQ